MSRANGVRRGGFPYRRGDSSVKRSVTVMRDRQILFLLHIPPQSPAVPAPPFIKGEAKSMDISNAAAKIFAAAFYISIITNYAFLITNYFKRLRYKYRRSRRRRGFQGLRGACSAPLTAPLIPRRRTPCRSALLQVRACFRRHYYFSF